MFETTVKAIISPLPRVAALGTIRRMAIEIFLLTSFTIFVSGWLEYHALAWPRRITNVDVVNAVGPVHVLLSQFYRYFILIYYIYLDIKTSRLLKAISCTKFEWSPLWGKNCTTSTNLNLNFPSKWFHSDLVQEIVFNTSILQWVPISSYKADWYYYFT